MKIKEKENFNDHPETNDILNVFSFYTRNNRKYYVVSPPSCKGFLVLEDTEIDMIEPNFGEEYFNASCNAEIDIRHPILKDEKLYEGLLENDLDCYEVFIQKLNGEKNSQNW